LRRFYPNAQETKENNETDPGKGSKRKLKVKGINSKRSRGTGYSGMRRIITGRKGAVERYKERELK
jgi:hypothetical protein